MWFALATCHRMSKRASTMNNDIEKLENKIVSAIKSVTDQVQGEMVAVRQEMGAIKQHISTVVHDLSTKVESALAENGRKLDATINVVRAVQQEQQHQAAQIKRLEAACVSRAAMEMRNNTLYIAAVPLNGSLNAHNAAAAVKRVLAEAGVPICSGKEEGKVWSLGLCGFGPNNKKPGTFNATLQILTSEERYLILNQRVGNNLKAQGISIGVDMTPIEQQNRSKLFADARFKAAYDKASEIRKQRGLQACMKRWVLDKCILGTGNGRETVEWSVEYLQQLDAQERAAAAAMQVNLVNN